MNQRSLRARAISANFAASPASCSDFCCTPPNFSPRSVRFCPTSLSRCRAIASLDPGALAPEGALDKAWDATSDKKKTRVKLGGGFYCGQIEVDGIKYCEWGAHATRIHAYHMT